MREGENNSSSFSQSYGKPLVEVLANSCFLTEAHEGTIFEDAVPFEI